MQILNQLRKYGLTEKQSKIYLALVKRIEASAYTLAKDTEIPRATIYELLEDMKAQGIVSSSRVNGVILYTAESPNRLLKLLKEKEDALQQILPSLLALGSKRELSPDARLYLGREGTSRVLDDILETLQNSENKQLYAIAGIKLHYEHSEILKKWIVRREKMGVHSKLIAYDNGKGVEPELYPTNIYRETRLIPPRFAFDTTLDIYANKVAIFSEIDGKEHSIIIESPSISETFRKFHEFMWEHAKKTST